MVNSKGAGLLAWAHPSVPFCDEELEIFMIGTVSTLIDQPRKECLQIRLGWPV